jgi:predicted Rossmann fold nucleotide-binding protein DprA/Smf involved in DNA uptake
VATVVRSFAIQGIDAFIASGEHPVPDHRKKGYIRLMERIEEKGLLLSEYPPGVRPSQYTFPRRNRLISAWSDKLIVIGAGNRSGAHIA